MKTLVTLGRECFDTEYVGTGNPNGRDGYLHNFKLKDLIKDRGLRNVSLSLSGTDRVLIRDFDARVETVGLNVVRRAFDSGTFNFETPVVPNQYHELPLKVDDFDPQKKADDKTIQRFIKFGAYCLGFKYSPNEPSLFVDFDCPEELDYLGANSKDIGRNIRLLTEEGFLRESAITLDNPLRVLPTAKLIREIEGEDTKSSPEIGTTLPLSDLERDICKFVVHRFLNQSEITTKRALQKQFRDSLTSPIQKLVSRYLLKAVDHVHTQETYLPRAIAFHYCGDAAALSFARRSTEIVLRVVLILFERMLENENNDPTPFTPADVETEARKFESDVDAKMIRFGLYLAEEFSVFDSLQRDEQQMWTVSFRPGARIYDVMKEDDTWGEHIRQSNVSVEGAWEKPHSESSLTAEPSVKDIFDIQNSIFPFDIKTARSDSRKIFLVHGHAEEVKQTVAKFLKTLNLDVVILHEQPNRGRTIVEKFERHSDVAFAVVLLTPDDTGAPINDATKTKKRARQNVILELGYFIGKLGRGRVCPIYVEEVELPSDLHGVLWVAYDKNGEWRSKLAKEINAAGIEVKIG